MMKKYSISVSKYRGFSLTELLVAIGIFAILTTIIIVAVKGVRDRAHDTGCVAQLRGIGAAVHMYVADNNGELPFVRENSIIKLSSPNYRTWAVSLAPYIAGISFSEGTAAENQTKLSLLAPHFRCPADEAFREDVDHGWSYGWSFGLGATRNGGSGVNYPMSRITNYPNPSMVVAASDAYHNSSGLNFGTAVSCDSAQAPTTEKPGTHLRHPYSGKAMTSEEILNSPPRRNVLYLDGHVGKTHITIYDIRRPELEKRGLFE